MVRNYPPMTYLSQGYNLGQGRYTQVAVEIFFA